MLLKDIQKNVSNVKYSKIWYRVWYVFKKNLNIKWIKEIITIIIIKIYFMNIIIIRYNYQRLCNF